MSENIEKAVPTEESPKTKESETSAPAATDNVVLYPVADISAAQETTDTETAASKEITDPQNTDNQTTIDSKTTDGKAADNADKFSDTRNTKEFTNNRKNPAPKMNIRSVSFSLISVPNARSK